MSPERIQRRRTPGWKLPPGAICVDRSSRWGNRYRLAKREDSPFPMGHAVVLDRRGELGPFFGGFSTALEAQAFAVELFRRALLASRVVWDPPAHASYFGPLAGHDLACYCRPGDPCHAEVLLELANQDGAR